LNLLDGGLCRQSVLDRVFNLADPAAVIGKHAIGFQNLAVFACRGNLAAGQQIVDRQPQPVDGAFKACRFLVGVFSDEIGDDDARLMQHDVPQAHAFGKPDTGCGDWPGQVQAGRLLRNRLQFSRRHHLGDHHGRCLERLDFVFEIGAV